MTEARPAARAPENEDELRDRLEAGLLEETHYLDVKRELGSGASKNKELAKDLAQFGIDSGALVFGIEEKDDGPDELRPIELHGLAERIEQVARTAIDPPLSVRCRKIPSAQDPSMGYLWVEIPASVMAPHMVDGTYYGRGDKTRIRLSDPEVQRLLVARTAAADRVDAHLDAYVHRDPVPAHRRMQAHLFVVLMPAAPRPEALLRALEGRDLHSEVLRLMREATDGQPNPGIRPGLAEATSFSRRTDGMALTSYGLHEGRRLDLSQRNGESAVEVEFTEDGGVRLMHTRLSFVDQHDAERLFEDVLPGLTRQAISVAGEVARTSEYAGVWLCGVAAVGLAGLPAHFDGSMSLLAEHLVPADVGEYRRTTTASTFELQEEPWEVANRLCGRYARMLGLTEYPPVRRFLAAPSQDA